MKMVSSFCLITSNSAGDQCLIFKLLIALARRYLRIPRANSDQGDIQFFFIVHAKCATEYSGVCRWQLPTVFDGKNNHSVIGVESYQSDVEIGPFSNLKGSFHDAPLSASEECIGGANKYEQSCEVIWLPTLPKVLGAFLVIVALCCAAHRLSLDARWGVGRSR